jgi:hypothetical protein
MPLGGISRRLEKGFFQPCNNQTKNKASEKSREKGRHSATKNAYISGWFKKVIKRVGLSSY